MCFWKMKKCEQPDIHLDETAIIGCWRLLSLIDAEGKKRSPQVEEFWSFAAMDDTDTFGVYACDYATDHTTIGRWKLQNHRLYVQCNECENEYIIAEVSEKKLILKHNSGNGSESIVFQRDV